MVADDPQKRIELKTFHNEILNDHQQLKKEQQGYRPIPIVREVTRTMIQSNFLQVKQDVEDLVMDRLNEMLNDPVKVTLIVKKSKTV